MMRNRLVLLFAGLFVTLILWGGSAWAQQAQTWTLSEQQVSLYAFNTEQLTKNSDGTYTLSSNSPMDSIYLNAYMKSIDNVAKSGSTAISDENRVDAINAGFFAVQDSVQVNESEVPGAKQAAVDQVVKSLGNLFTKSSTSNSKDNNSKDNNSKDNKDSQSNTKPNVPGVDTEEGASGDEQDKINGGGNQEATGGGGKVLMFLIDLRVIAYVISGFGMIAFAYAAIFNKINWKHFAAIAFGLFLLAMIGPFIQYFTGDTNVAANLQYGNYLGGRYQGINGTAGGGDTKILEGEIPEETVTAEKRKWNWKQDLVGSIKSGIDTVRGAYNTVKTATSAVNTIKQNADVLKNAIKGAGGGIDGILGAVGNAYGALNNIGYAANTGLGNVLGGIGSVADSAQDTFATEQQRDINANEREDGGSSNLVSGWINSESGGQLVTGTIGGMSDKIGQSAGTVSDALNAGHEGSTMGGGGVLGGILGTAMGVGQGIVSGAEQKEETKRQQEIEAQRAQEQAEWDKNAEIIKQQQEASRRQQEERQRQQAEAAQNPQPLENSLFSDKK